MDVELLYKELIKIYNSKSSGQELSSQLNSTLSRFKSERSNISYSEERDVGLLIRKIVDKASSLVHRKQFGQYFTPYPISSLVCASSINAHTGTIADPMCGTGNLIWAAIERAEFLGVLSKIKVTGFEIDPLIARVAEYPPNYEYSRFSTRPRIINEDSFIRMINKNINDEETENFDSVIGNPPYVRRENIPNLIKTSSPDVFNAFKRALGGKSDSYIAGIIIRTSLISNLITDCDDIDQLARKGIELINGKKSDCYSNSEKIWLNMVTGYSGLADLSLPSWLLTWRIAKPGSIVSYVTTSSWRTRDYARMLRYYMLRMLEPVLIIEQEGRNWFQDALQPTSLMTFKIRSFNELQIPLSERSSGREIPIIKVRKEFDLSDPKVYKKIAEDLGYDAQRDKCGFADLSDFILGEMYRGESNLYWTKDNITERSLINALLTENQYSGNGGKVSIDKLENYDDSDIKIIRHNNSTKMIPEMIIRNLAIPRDMDDTFVFFNDLGIDINQGLRTGCNAFFYVKKLDDAQITELMKMDGKQVRMILAHPNDNKEKYFLILLKLKTITTLIPDGSFNSDTEYMLVQTSSELGSRLALFPRKFMLPVVRYSNDLLQYSVRREMLYNYLIHTGKSLIMDDYLKTRKYPIGWQNAWDSRDNLSILPPCIGKYIESGQHTIVERNGKKVQIPDLSAVHPNIRWPTIPTVLPLIENDSKVPPSPGSWYSLNLQSRHFGHILMSRVNYGHPQAFINSMDVASIVDANFSTISNNSNYFSNKALFAFLNSCWVRAVLECIGTPMGGGALKVEASHLKRIPIPRFNETLLVKLDELGEELIKIDKNCGQEIIDKIDWIVSSHIAKDHNLDETNVYKQLKKICYEQLNNRMGFKKKSI